MYKDNSVVSLQGKQRMAPEFSWSYFPASYICSVFVIMIFPNIKSDILDAPERKTIWYTLLVYRVWNFYSSLMIYGDDETECFIQFFFDSQSVHFLVLSLYQTFSSPHGKNMFWWYTISVTYVLWFSKFSVESALYQLISSFQC